MVSRKLTRHTTSVISTRFCGRPLGNASRIPEITHSTVPNCKKVIYVVNRTPVDIVNNTIVCHSNSNCIHVGIKVTNFMRNSCIKVELSHKRHMHNFPEYPQLFARILLDANKELVVWSLFTILTTFTVWICLPVILWGYDLHRDLDILYSYDMWQVLRGYTIVKRNFLEMLNRYICWFLYISMVPINTFAGSYTFQWSQSIRFLVPILYHGGNQ